jgi:hypothetical protein
MRKATTVNVVAILGLAAASVMPVHAGVLYNNLTPTDAMGIASRPDAGSFEIEAADDFVLASHSFVTSASFIGILVPGPSGALPTVSDVIVEMYRVFPKDSDTVRVPKVPTRTNSPSDVAFASKDAAGGDLAFATSTLNGSFTVRNSVQPGGIHAFPNQTTGGDGALTGLEVQFDVTFTTPFDLPADHYFFVPQVALDDGAQFYWLSASRPISGAGTTPFAPDLQAWTRDAGLDPDWLRVGTDIVGGTTAPAPTFNAAFSLTGSVPEPSTIVLLLSALLGSGVVRRRTMRGGKSSS